MLNQPWNFLIFFLVFYVSSSVILQILKYLSGKPVSRPLSIFSVFGVSSIVAYFSTPGAVRHPGVFQSEFLDSFVPPIQILFIFYFTFALSTIFAFAVFVGVTGKTKKEEIKKLKTEILGISLLSYILGTFVAYYVVLM